MAKVTSKLQITLPKRIAEKHGIAPGDEIRFESTGHSIAIIPGKQPGQEQLSRDERLRLFDEATRRLQARAAELPAATPSPRDWRREDLYLRGTAD
jgi:AbrB family looped-hinge helix DNA binding protein